jgi:signal transduction histidine kinase
MARLKLGLEGRAVLGIVLIQLIALTIVAGMLLVVARETLTGSFVQRVRTTARGVADALEIPSVLQDERQARDVLDSVILTGEAVYADLLDQGRRKVSALSHRDVSYQGVQDLEFFEHPGATYFIVLPLNIQGHVSEVRLGFDKRPTLNNIAQIRQNTVEVLGAYAALSLALATIFVRHLSRPLARLRRSARQVASGDYERHLSAETGIPEIEDLADDLETMRRELVGVNARLTREIIERQRAEAQRAALESELRRRQRLETIGRLAGGVAHEINNSLVPILVYAKVVFDALPAGSPGREHLSKILLSARRSKEVVKKVLTFSRQLDAGHLEMLDLSGPVEEVVDLLRTSAPAAIRVVKRIGPDCPMVRADATLINSLTMNLCTNAMQAMGASGGTLTVTLDLRSVPSEHTTLGTVASYLELCVEDTGHGMSAATLERIFEPFFTTRAPGEGTGLGLAVVHGIAESLGATVHVESTPGVGTIFKVSFPVPDR